MKKFSKKFLAIILVLVLLPLFLVMQSHATKSTPHEDKSAQDGQKVQKSILAEKEKEIQYKFFELTGMKVKKLLYRASKDGYKIDDFHKKCDGHSNTITIIKVKDGDIVGAYTSVIWRSICASVRVKDTKAFLFSLTKNKIYKIRPEKSRKAVFMNEDFGPTFGRLDAYKNELTVTSMDGFLTGVSALGVICVKGDTSSCYEENGDDAGTFIGYVSSKKTVLFQFDDYEVYEVE